MNRENRQSSLGLARLIAAGLAFGFGLPGGLAEAAQAGTGTIRVEVVADGRPVERAAVSAAGELSMTDAAGVAVLTRPAGDVTVVASKEGYVAAAARVAVVAGGERLVRLVLIEPDATVVTSTRSLSRQGDQAVPVDIVTRPVLERQMLLAPGDIAGLLDQASGLRAQTTSPVLGTTVVRIQGLRGRYTRLLSDGVPLYGDRPGGLGWLQIPPLDLDRVEILKGAASAFYGADAMAGVVNLISRRPGPRRAGEWLVGQSARGATDTSLWLSSPSIGAANPSRSWSSTFLASAHRQEETDVDGDGWSDLARVQRLVARPRVYWTSKRGRTIAGTAGVTVEEREGGSAIARESLNSKSADGSLSGEMLLPSGNILAGAGALFVKSRTRGFGSDRERDRHQAATIDLSLRGRTMRHAWATGMAIEWYAVRSVDRLPSTYVSTRGGLFVHDDILLAPWLVVSGGARVDHHNRFGVRLNPRGSALVRGGPWSARVSAGLGYHSPTMYTEETEAAGFARLTVEGPLEMERARSVSADLTHRTGSTSVTLALFQSRIEHAAVVERATYTLRTSADPIATSGAELAATVRVAALSVSGAYTFVHPRAGGRDEALTPRHHAVVIAAVETARGRAGVKLSATGAQRLESNPYRSRSEPYRIVDLFGERRFGSWRVFVSAENVGDVRQTRWDPIARPERDRDGRWTVDAWAPMAGRLIRAGAGISF